MRIANLLLTFFLLLIFVGQTSAQYNFEKYLEDAKKDLNNNNFNAAINNLNICLQAEPTAFEAFYFRGIAKYYLHDDLGAEQDLDLATTNYSSWYYDAIHYRAMVKDRLENFQGAISDFNKVIDKVANNGQLYLERSFSKLSSQDYNGAIRDCNKAMSMNVVSEDVFMCRGAAETALNDYEKALMDFDKVIELRPGNQNALVRRGMVKAKTGKSKEAIEDYNAALKIDSGCTFAYYNRAAAKMDENDTKGVIADYTMLLKYEPTNALTYYNRAVLEANTNDFKSALADFDKVLALNPENIQALFNHAKMKQALHDYKGALDDYDKTIQLFPYFTEAYYERALLKKSIGDFQGAEKDDDLGKLMSDLNHSKNRSQVARDSVTLSHMTELNYDFNNVNPNSIDTVDIHILPIFCFVLKSSDYKSTLGDRPVLLKTRKRNYSSIFLTNKDVRIKNAVADSSIIVSKKATKNISYEDSLFNVAIQKTTMQFYNDATVDYDRILVKDPTFAIAYCARGINACKEIELLNKFNNDILLPNQPKTVVKNQKDEIYQKALSDFNKAIQLEPEFAVAYYNRAYVKCQLRDFNGAVKDYDNAIKSDPSFAEAYYNRGLFLLYMKEKLGACHDFSKAGELGLSESYAAIKKYCPRNFEK